MMLRMSCACGRTLVADTALAGTSARCEQCGRVYVVPAVNGAAGGAGRPAGNRGDATWLPPVVGAVLSILAIVLALMWALSARSGAGAGGPGGGKRGIGGAPTGEGSGADNQAAGEGADATSQNPTAPPVKPPEMGVSFNPTPPVFKQPGRAGVKGAGGTFDFGEGWGSKFVYVIDRSSSMSGARFAAVTDELIANIRGLKPEYEFYVIFYNTSYVQMPGSGLVRATPENKEKAIKWIRTINPMGGTDPVGATKRAIELNPHTVLLLSDGEFRSGACEAIAKANGGGRVSICTIGFHSRTAERTLKRIAAENNGDYKFVPASATARSGRTPARFPSRPTPPPFTP